MSELKDENGRARLSLGRLGRREGVYVLDSRVADDSVDLGGGWVEWTV